MSGLDVTGNGRLMPTDEEFYLLNELIEENFGLSFPDHKRVVLAGRLRPRILALHLTSFKEYYLRLHSNVEGEMDVLAVLATNNETYLFREQNHFDALLHEGIPALRQDLAVRGTLRILCAGCSSGEEPYTINFYLRDAGRHLGLEPSIDAFDIDSQRLAMARNASYRARSLREMTEDQVRRYLEPSDEGRFDVKLAYRDGVRFSAGNIVDVSTYQGPLAYDVLFCRNVLIYFSEAALNRAIESFASVLRPGGLLFLGHSESIIGRSRRFESVRLGRSVVYRKVGS